MPIIKFSGKPGDTWQNETGRIQYQLLVAWSNTCGVCAQYDHAVGNSFPIPFHYGCNCRQIAIRPMARSEPFVDFRAEIEKLDEEQQKRVVGASNYKLLQSGDVSWKDVVTEGRVRDLREVVSMKRLSVDKMVKAGVKPRDAAEAYRTVNTKAHVHAEESRRRLLEAIQKKGVSIESAKREIADRLANRVRMPVPTQPTQQELLDRLNEKAKAGLIKPGKPDRREPGIAQAMPTDPEARKIFIEKRREYQEASRDRQKGVAPPPVIAPPPIEPPPVKPKYRWKPKPKPPVEPPQPVAPPIKPLPPPPPIATPPQPPIELPPVFAVHSQNALIAAAEKRQQLSNLEYSARNPGSKVKGSSLNLQERGKEGKAIESTEKAIADLKRLMDANIDLDSMRTELKRLYEQAFGPASTPSEKDKLGRKWATFKYKFDQYKDAAIDGPSRLAKLEAKLDKLTANAPKVVQTASQFADYASLQRKNPNLLPPGSIKERLDAYLVGDAKLAAIKEQSSKHAHQLDDINKKLRENDKKLIQLLKDKTSRDSAKNKVRDEASNLTAERMRILEQQRADVFELIKVKDPSVFSAKDVKDGYQSLDGSILNSLGRSPRTRTEEASQWLGNIFVKHDSEGLDVRIGEKEKVRPHYNADHKYIQISPFDQVKVIVHELGHAIDEQMTTGGVKALDRSLEFLEHRVGSEALVEMRKVVPGGAYGVGEMGRKDKFDQVFDTNSAYYTGKSYGGRATEILSMGVQALYEDPAGFAKKDPEFFKYVLGMADGSLR